MFGNEKRIKSPSLKHLRKRHQVLKIEVCVRIASGTAPPRGMNGIRAHEGARVHAAIARHGSLWDCDGRTWRIERPRIPHAYPDDHIGVKCGPGRTPEECSDRWQAISR